MVRTDGLVDQQWFVVETCMESLTSVIHDLSWI